MNGQRRTLQQEISAKVNLSPPGVELLHDRGYRPHELSRDVWSAAGAADEASAATSFSIWHSKETGSTNADLAAIAAGSTSSGMVLITDHQRSGRGRQRRTWLDEPGSALLSSVFWQVSAQGLPLLPLSVGLAVADSVEDLAGKTGVSEPQRSVVLKWPNDVLAPGLDGRKLAGILVEVSPLTGAGRGLSFGAVIGVGLNVRQSTLNPEVMPPEVSSRAATLAEVIRTGGGDEAKATRDAVLATYLPALHRRLTMLDDPEAVRMSYRSRCLTIGRRVRFETAKNVVVGSAVDIDDQGGLVVVDEAGEQHHLNAGDAHHL